MSEGGPVGLTYDKEQYDKWKQLTPLLYDWFTNHNLTWPSLSCRWGRVTDEHQYKRRQLLYLSEQARAATCDCPGACSAALPAPLRGGSLPPRSGSAPCPCRPPGTPRTR